MSGASPSLRQHIVAMALLILMVAAIAWPHLSGEVTFIGDSDRLNTFLNIKLAETISIQETGRVPAWSEHSFMGYNLRGLYWMLPGANLDAYIHARLPIERLYWNAGLVTFGLLLVALLVAYAFLFDLTRRPLAAAIGAATFGCSALSLGRLAQVDSAYLTIALMPLAMLALRRQTEDVWRRWFAVLTGCIAVMLGLAFLQEAAYVLLLIGAYALFRAARTRSLNPAAAFVAATLAGLLIASPRVITAGEEFELMFRTTQASYTGPTEVLRVLNDGMFGRYWEEAWEVIGNVGFNIHEGVQTYSSTVAAVLVLLLLFIVDLRKHLLPVGVLMGVFAAVLYTSRPKLGIATALVTLMVAAFEYRAPEHRYRVPISDRGEFGFHVCAFAISLGFVLVPALRAVLYYGFFKIDFLHSRVVVAAILPLAAVVAMLLAGLAKQIDLAHQEDTGCARLWTYGVCALVAVAALHLVVNGWDANLDITARKMRLLNLNLSVGVVVRTVILLALTIVAILVLRSARAGPPSRAIVAVALAATIAFECFLYARERLLGEHTNTYPVAFRSGNYFSAPPGTLQPPSRECRAWLHERLADERYRSVVVADSARFHPFAAPHLSQFWQLRLLDGYPGLPMKLAELPWPAGIANLRSIAFRSTKDVPWLLLSVLNVRNVIVLSEAFYYNVAYGGKPERGCPGLAGLAVLENPYPVLPRAFFVSKLLPMPTEDPLKPIERFTARSIGPGRILVKWWAQIRDGDVEVQIRRVGTARYGTAAGYSPLSDRQVVVGGLTPGASYEVRMRKINRRGKELFATTSIPITMPIGMVDEISPSLTEDDSLVYKAFPYDARLSAMVEGIESTSTFAVDGQVRAKYSADVMRFEFDPLQQARFLVINELFHPRWRAYVDGRPQLVLLANRVMQGVEIPPGARMAELRFEPFSNTRAAVLLVALGVLIFATFLFAGRVLSARFPQGK